MIDQIVDHRRSGSITRISIAVVGKVIAQNRNIRAPIEQQSHRVTIQGMRNYAVTYGNIRAIAIETAIFTPTNTAMIENHIVSGLVGIQNNRDGIGAIRRVITEPESHVLNENIMGILADNKSSISNSDSRRRSRLSGDRNIGAIKIQHTSQGNISRDFEDDYSRSRGLDCSTQGTRAGIIQIGDFINRPAATGRSGNPESTPSGEDRDVATGKVKGHAVATAAQATTQIPLVDTSRPVQYVRTATVCVTDLVTGNRSVAAFAARIIRDTTVVGFLTGLVGRTGVAFMNTAATLTTMIASVAIITVIA
jgi:hypothetical protein